MGGGPLLHIDLCLRVLDRIISFEDSYLRGLSILVSPYILMDDMAGHKKGANIALAPGW